MSNNALKVENLSKLYRIGMREKKHETFMGALTSWVTAPLTNYRRLRRLTHFDAPVSGQSLPVPGLPSPVSQDDLLWALKDISFEIKQGEVVGIIGRNGAGKSTLLKILSRITEPTSGRAIINGRVASLLEVGTGFHAELTGRENIYLNGTILGMTKKEVNKKFDEIVDFAEIEKFIDTPVKHYSSGMYVRLAFAVAAHLEPEILLVDEVLAVGDASFQKKCLGKMKDVATQGRTVLFVSHQMGAVKSLCSRVIEINKGSVIRDGDPETVINGYLGSTPQAFTSERKWDDPRSRPGNDLVRLIALRVLNLSGQSQALYSTSEPIIIETEVELVRHHRALFIGFDLMNQYRVILFRSCHNHLAETEWPRLRLGYNKLRCALPGNLFNNGVYYVAPRIGLQLLNWIVFDDSEVTFEVQMDHCKSPFWSNSHTISFPGVIAPFLPWRSVETEPSDIARPLINHAYS
jgi:lipopolysaccharide transport system ATP-binding protein